MEVTGLSKGAGVPSSDIIDARVIIDNYHTLFIIVLYIPPHTLIQQFDLFFDSFSSLEFFSNNNHFLVIRDFNTPNNASSYIILLGL